MAEFRYSPAGIPGRRRQVLPGEPAILMTLLAFLFALPVPAPCLPVADAAFRPNRVLLVIGDQWSDPSGFLVREGNEFHELASLLKNWAIPFDILRLDQQKLDRNDFLGFDGKARYGAVLWDADPALFKDQNYALLADAVDKWNIGLVILSNRVQQPVLESLAGVHYRGYYSSSAPIVAQETSGYLLHDLPGVLDANNDPRLAITASGLDGAKIPWTFPPFKKRVLVESAGATVLATQGGVPQITDRELRTGLHVIWIGSDYSALLHFQALRTVLRRSLALAVGYQLYRDWSREAILEMDDVGSAQNSWLESWHYPTLTQEQIEERLIGPLVREHARLVINACPGFVDVRARTIVPSFTQVFTDEFGTRQDYVSTKRGLEEGLQQGVFEIQSHGWTHMQPDLDSAPGPWWDAPLDQEKAEVGWYREFGDTRRGQEIPAAVQRMHMQKSIEWLQEEFGVEPLSFVAGGNGISESFPNNTTVLAARAGFGWFGDYEGPDLAIEALAGYSGMGGSEFGGTADAPLVIWIPPDGHDRGIAQKPEEFPRIFALLQGRRYGGMNEYIAYLHATMRSETASELNVSLDYDGRYCRYFEKHSSEWRVDAPGIAGPLSVTVDGKPEHLISGESGAAITIPPGLGTHRVEIRSEGR
jgi:hypothetical protein